MMYGAGGGLTAAPLHSYAMQCNAMQCNRVSTSKFSFCSFPVFYWSAAPPSNASLRCANGSAWVGW